MFYDTPKIDIFVQEDYIFIMNRRMWLKEGVKTWFTDMLPNIGLFLCRGNDKVVKVFELAWAQVTPCLHRSGPLCVCPRHVLLTKYPNTPPVLPRHACAVSKNGGRRAKEEPREGPEPRAGRDA